MVGVIVVMKCVGEENTMNGKVARRLRKAASGLCDKEQGNYITKWHKRFLDKTDDKGEPMVKVTGSVMWPAISFMGIYRRLKREYKEHPSCTEKRY